MTKLMQRFKAFVAGLVQRYRDRRESYRRIDQEWRDSANYVAGQLLAGAFGATTPANISPWVSVNRYRKFSMLGIGSIDRMVRQAIKRGLEGATTVESFELAIEEESFDTILLQLRLRRIKY